MTKMRFGVQTSINGVTWSELADMWRFLDTETQLYSAWTFDHFVPPGVGQDPNGSCFEGWSSLAALAAITDRIRLGCLVTVQVERLADHFGSSRMRSSGSET